MNPDQPKKPSHYPAIDLGPLPVEAVNGVLNTELEAGNVRLSSQAHRHMAEDHPDDYETCRAALHLAIAAPTFIGQAPGHVRNFEMIRRTRLSDGRAVLVAIAIDQDSSGDYRVRSCYLVDAATVDKRRKAGRLRPPPAAR